MPKKLQHALKTGLAAALTLLVYEVLPLPDKTHHAWAVVSAVLVMQSNLGGMLKAAWNRWLGSLIGGLTGAAFASLLGNGAGSLGLAVGFVVGVCAALGLQESLRLAGATVALVMLIPSDSGGPWWVGANRVLDVAVGIGVAVLIQATVWPARAGAELRAGLLKVLENCRTLYFGCFPPPGAGPTVAALDEARDALEELLPKNRELLRDLQREPGDHREDLARLTPLLGLSEELENHLLSLETAQRGMAGDEFVRQFAGTLDQLADATRQAFDWLLAAVASRSPTGKPPEVNAVLSRIDEELTRLRSAGGTLRYPVGEVVRFCTFYFHAQAVGRLLAAMIGAREPQKPAAAPTPA